MLWATQPNNCFCRNEHWSKVWTTTENTQTLRHAQRLSRSPERMPLADWIASISCKRAFCRMSKFFTTKSHSPWRSAKAPPRPSEQSGKAASQKRQNHIHNIYIHIYVYTYTYIYIEREREREKTFRPAKGGPSKREENADSNAHLVFEKVYVCKQLYFRKCNLVFWCVGCVLCYELMFWVLV